MTSHGLLDRDPERAKKIAREPLKAFLLVEHRADFLAALYIFR